MKTVTLLVTTKIDGEFILAGEKVEVSEEKKESLMKQGFVSASEVEEVEETEEVEEVEETEEVENKKTKSTKEKVDLLGEGK